MGFGSAIVVSDPTEFDVDPTTDRVVVRVDDDGPGLPEYERRILTGGDETGLEHGSGLGLAPVFWTVANLDGEIDVSASDRGTPVTLRLRRAASILSGAN